MKRNATITAFSLTLAIAIGCGSTTDPTSTSAPADRAAVESPPELTIEIRKPDDDSEAIRLRLDPERAQANNISLYDLRDAVTISSVLGNDRPKPPPRVVYEDKLRETRYYGEIILRANEKGDLLRLKEVATIERITRP